MLVRGIIFGPVLRGVVLCLVVVAIAVVNESASDLVNQLAMACIVGGAGLVGFVWMRRVWLAGLLTGCTVAVEHVVALALGVEIPDVHLPPGWWGSASLLILLVPALIGAYAGAGLRRLAAGRSGA